MNASPAAPKTTIDWLNVIRLGAFFCLLCCHAADPFNAAVTYGNGAAPVDASYPFWGAIWGALARPCVPLFVMLTGALLLPVKQEMGAFYRKRIPRVLFPFLIWSVLYNLFPWFTSLVGADKSVIYDFFVWAQSDNQSLTACLANIARIPYHFNPIACHMWYIYLLIGLYLYMPIFSAWVERASEKQKRFVLLLWLLTTLLPYLREYVSHYNLGTCEWNEFGMLYYFAGFNGYLLLGHYLRHHTASLGMGRALAGALPLFAAGFYVTWQGFVHITALPHATPEQMELFWTYNSLNVALMSGALFVVLQQTRVTSPRLGRLLQNFTLCGFGIYMIHYFFVGPFYRVALSLAIPVPLIIPFSALCILVSSWAVVACIKRLLGRKSTILVG